MTRDSVFSGQNAYLDKAELRYVRGQLGGEKRQLLDFLLDKKEWEEDEIRKRLGGISKGQLATLKAKLQTSIATTVGEYRFRALPDGQVQALTYATDTLLNTGQFLAAQRTLAKALKCALQYDNHTYLHTLEALRERIPHFLVGNKTAEKNWPAIDQDLAVLKAAQQHLAQIKIGYGARLRSGMAVCRAIRQRPNSCCLN